MPPIRRFCIDKEQEDNIRELVSKKVKVKEIAIKYKCSRATVWRIMVELGINKPRNKSPHQNKIQEIFNWNKYPNGLI